MLLPQLAPLVLTPIQQLLLAVLSQAETVQRLQNEQLMIDTTIASSSFQTHSVFDEFCAENVVVQVHVQAHKLPLECKTVGRGRYNYTNQ